MLRTYTYSKLFWIIVLFLIFQKTSVAQDAGKVGIIDRGVNPGGIIDELPLAPAKTVGNTYINDEWMLGKLVLFTNMELIGHPMKYDLKNKQLEIKFEGQVKICPLEKIKTFSWRRNNIDDTLHFINSRYLPKAKNSNPRTILNRLYIGNNTSLYKEYYLELKAATYVAALDMGEKNNKIHIKQTYYLLSDGDTFYKLSPSLRKNKSVFGDYYNSIQIYQKKYKLKLKKEKDVIELMKYYESLL
jgi:hypothetical protein